MRGAFRRSGSTTLMDGLWVLRTRAYGKELAALLALLGDVIDAADIPRMLRYLVGCGHVREVGAGANVRYVLNDAAGADDIIEQKRERASLEWAGAWHVFTYDIPNTHSTDRRRIVRLLHQMGWAQLGRSAWLSPYDWTDLLKRSLANADRRARFYCMRCTDVASPVGTDGQDLSKLWDLKDIAARYRQLLRICSKAPKGSGYSARQGRVAAIMQARHQLRLVERMDPMLPSSLLPATWLRDDVLAGLEKLRHRVEGESRLSETAR
jgi:phenylacetic acid degradation operon negative regulatory protein